MIRVRACRDLFDGKTRVYESALDPDGEPVSFYRAFSGKANRGEGKPFAFVDDGDESVFLPPEIVDAERIRDGDLVAGVALHLVNPKNGRLAWRAVRLETREPGEGRGAADKEGAA